MEQFGFDFCTEAPQAVSAPVAAWLEPDFTKAEWLARIERAEKDARRVVGHARPLFAQNIEAARVYFTARDDDGETFSFRGRGIDVTDEQRQAFFAYVVTFTASSFPGIEYKYRDEGWIKTAAMHVEGVGTLIAREWTADNGNLYYVPWRDTFFNDSFRDDSRRVFVHAAVWVKAYAAQKIAEAGKKVPSVPTFMLNGREYVQTGNTSARGVREATVWSLMPVGDWKGETLTYSSMCRAWDNGTAERGDQRGLLVQVRGQLCVLAEGMRVYDDSATAMDANYSEPNETDLSDEDDDAPELEADEHDEQEGMLIEH
jgi:hypothetical protein